MQMTYLSGMENLDSQGFLQFNNIHPAIKFSLKCICTYSALLITLKNLQK